MHTDWKRMPPTCVAMATCSLRPTARNAMQVSGRVRVGGTAMVKNATVVTARKGREGAGCGRLIRGTQVSCS